MLDAVLEGTPSLPAPTFYEVQGGRELSKAVQFAPESVDLQLYLSCRCFNTTPDIGLRSQEEGDQGSPQTLRHLLSQKELWARNSLSGSSVLKH